MIMVRYMRKLVNNDVFNRRLRVCHKPPRKADRVFAAARAEARFGRGDFNRRGAKTHKRRISFHQGRQAKPCLL